MPTKDPRSLEVPGKAWITDSRAYNLIWLGRWVERAYGIANALDAIAHSAPDEPSFVHDAEALAETWGVEGDAISGLRDTLETCVRVARDDASQVGPLELLQLLNDLLTDLPALWSGDSRSEIAASIDQLRPRIDAIAGAIESRWFRRVESD